MKESTELGHQDHNRLTVRVQSTRGEKTLEFEKQTKILEVIRRAVQEFGFQGGDKFDLVLASNPGEVLDPQRTLVSYHLEDRVLLILTAVGGGV